MASLRPLELPPQSMVVVAARFLAAGQVSVADVQSMSRYSPAAGIQLLVDAHRRLGLISSVDGGDDVFTASPELRAGATAVLRLQAEEAERLWGESVDLASDEELARAHVDAAIESPLPLDAFRRQVGVHHALPSSHAAQLLGYVTELRYLRSDVHAACLAKERLSGARARTLHSLWRGFDPKETIDTSLVEQGFVDLEASGPVVTETGSVTCERIENATNVVFADVFHTVDEGASIALLSSMRSLAGEDPRPVEDR
jgi:hypothetical protein